MPRRLNPETLLLLDCLASAVADTAELLLHPTFGRFASGASWSDERLDRKILQLAARGIIQLPRPADPRTVRLTEAGRQLARGDIDPEARWNRPWDGIWRMVLFDVCEADRKLRDNLRRTLSLARLGYLQGSVWVTPDPLGALRATITAIAPDPESLLFFEGRPSAGESDTSIVAGGWNFRRINDAYADVIALHKTMPRANDQPGRWRQWLDEERTAWTSARQADPFLPASLIPHGYRGHEALHSHRQAMARAAQHIFSPQ